MSSRGPSLSCALVIELKLDWILLLLGAWLVDACNCLRHNNMLVTLLSFFLSARSRSTYLRPLKLPVCAFIYPFLFATLSKAKILDQVYLVKELSHQLVLVVHSLSQLVNSKTEVYLTS